MNNKLREWLMKNFEFKIMKKFLKKHSIELHQKELIDIGCGSGFSTKLLIKKFKPKIIHAFDLLSSQIDLAKERGLEANFFVGDVTNLEISDESIDAAFIFGILHHVPKWKDGLMEIFRILKPKGIFIVEEPTRKFIEHAEKHGFNHNIELSCDFSQFARVLQDGNFSILEKKLRLTGNFMTFLCEKPNEY
jgi:ubiquinone/menaquinone biosynthesis C-methylase UbiE